MSEKLIALLEGLQVADPIYWSNKSEKELREMGRACTNCMSLKKEEKKNLIDALIDCADRLRLLKDNGRAKTLDLVAIEKADVVLARYGVCVDD